MDSDLDASEPTDAQVATDRELAIQVAVAFLSNAAMLANPILGLAALSFAPIAQAIATAAVRRLGARRAEHAADTLLDGAQSADLTLEEFLDRAVSDDRRHELTARTLRIAQDTALREKRRALGRALAAGIMGDDARIDEELLFVRAVDDIDEMHIRVLARLAIPTGTGGWTAASIEEADPGLGSSVLTLLGTMELHGLIASRVPPRPTGVGGMNPFFSITASGQEFLARLADDPS